MLYSRNMKIYGRNDTQRRRTTVYLSVALACMIAMPTVSLTPREAKAEVATALTVVATSATLLSLIVSWFDSGSNVTALTVQQNRDMLPKNLMVLKQFNDRLNEYNQAMETLLEKIDDLPAAIRKEFERTSKQRDTRQIIAILQAHHDYPGTDKILHARIQEYQKLCGSLILSLDPGKDRAFNQLVGILGDKLINLMSCAVGELIVLLPRQFFLETSRPRSRGPIKDRTGKAVIDHIGPRASRYVKTFHAVLPLAHRMEQAYFSYTRSFQNNRMQRFHSIEQILSELAARPSPRSCSNDLGPCMGEISWPDYEAIRLVNQATSILVSSGSLVEELQELPCDRNSRNKEPLIYSPLREDNGSEKRRQGVE